MAIPSLPTVPNTSCSNITFTNDWGIKDKGVQVGAAQIIKDAFEVKQLGSYFMATYLTSVQIVDCSGRVVAKQFTPIGQGIEMHPDKNLVLLNNGLTILAFNTVNGASSIFREVRFPEMPASPTVGL